MRQCHFGLSGAYPENAGDTEHYGHFRWHRDRLPFSPPTFKVPAIWIAECNLTYLGI